MDILCILYVTLFLAHVPWLPLSVCISLSAKSVQKRTIYSVVSSHPEESMCSLPGGDFWHNILMSGDAVFQARVPLFNVVVRLLPPGDQTVVAIPHLRPLLGRRRQTGVVHAFITVFTDDQILLHEHMIRIIAAQSTSHRVFQPWSASARTRGRLCSRHKSSRPP